MTLYRHSRMVAANDVRRYLTQLRDNNNSENSPGKPRPLFYLRREDLNNSREGTANRSENRWSYPHTERQRNYRNTLRLARANRRGSTPGIAIPFSDDVNESEDDSDHIARSPGDESDPFFEDSNSITSPDPNQKEGTVVVHVQPNDIKLPTSPNIAFQALQALPEHHFRSLTRQQETDDVGQGPNNQGIEDPANLAAHMDWQKYWESHPVEPGTFWSMEIDEDVGLSEQPVTPSPDFPGMGQEEVTAGQHDSEIQEMGMDDEPECCPWPGCDWNEPTRLNTHIRRSHLKGLHCPINGCEARFGEQWQIRNHIKSVHPGMSENLPGRPQLESEVSFIQERLFSGRNKFTHSTKIAICTAQSPSELESITGLRNRVRLARTAWKARIGPDPPPQPPKPITPVQQVQQQSNNTIVSDTRPSGTKQTTNDFGASALEAFRMMNLSEPDAHSASIFASVLKRGFVDHQGRMERERAVRTFQLALDYTSSSINSSSAWNSGTGISVTNLLESPAGGSKDVKYTTLGQQNSDQYSLLLNIGYPSSGSNEPFQNSSPSPSSSTNQQRPVDHHIYAIPMTDMSTAGFPAGIPPPLPEKHAEKGGDIDSLNHEGLVTGPSLWYQ